MGKPYSDDLRRGVVQAIETGHTYEETADLCGVSISSISRFLTRWRRTGSVAHRNLAAIKGTHWSRTGVRSSDGWMLSPISPLPNCKLAWQSVTWWSVRLPSSASFVISTSPLKKSLHAAEQDRPDVVAARKSWFKMQMRLDPRRLAFIDETSVSTNMTRRYGRARGARLVCKSRMAIGKLRPSWLRCATMGSPLLCYWTGR